MSSQQLKNLSKDMDHLELIDETVKIIKKSEKGLNEAGPQSITTTECQNIIRKRRMATNSSSDIKPFAASCSNLQQEKQPGSKTYCGNCNSAQNTSNMRNENIYIDSHIQIEDGIDLGNGMVSLGPNKTPISAKIYRNMDWTSATLATRKLLLTIFNNKILATHTMNGEPMLDPAAIADIKYAVKRNCTVPDKAVRVIIQTKCADANIAMKFWMDERADLLKISRGNIISKL